jgi:hypothetical protein
MFLRFRSDIFSRSPFARAVKTVCAQAQIGIPGRPAIKQLDLTELEIPTGGKGFYPTLNCSWVHVALVPVIGCLLHKGLILDEKDFLQGF